MFAQQFPTVAVEGCHKLCATKAIEKYSGKTAATVDVERMLEERGWDPPASRRLLTPEDMAMVAEIVDVIAGRVDEIKEAQDA
jgi:hypothetical protein